MEAKKEGKTLFEMVCTANHGRSPVAELVGRLYLVDQGVIGAYDTISSGSLVDAIKARQVSPFALQKFVDLAIERGDILTEDERLVYGVERDAGFISEGNYSDDVNDIYWKVAERFQHEEHESRTYAMQHVLGISESKLKNGSDQTLVRPDVVMIMAMAQSNVDQLEKCVFTDATYRPKIVNLGIEDAFGRPRDAYLEAVDQIRERVPQEIERYLNSVR